MAVSCVGIALVTGPFGADGDVDGGGGPRQTGLRAQTERNGERTRVSVTGRVRPVEARDGAVLHVLARRDRPATCPIPTVAADAAITPPTGSLAVRWSADVGPPPGVVLPAGRPIRMVGDVAVPAGEARTLCVHLARGGARPVVLRSATVATPNASASSGSGVSTPLEEDALVLALVSLMVVAVVGGTLAITIAEARRRGRSWALPALPADVRVPDVVPSEDPLAPASRRRRWVRRVGERRLERWRAGRRAQAEQDGELFDPHERPPWHVAVWGVGDGGGRLSAERFRALGDLYPGVLALHDRRVPGPRGATIDHLLVGPAGVVVASSSRWDGFVEVVGERLIVAGANRTRAIDGVAGRVVAVRAILGAAGFAGVPVHGVLHCVVTEDVLLDGSLRLQDVPLLDALGTLGRAVDAELLGPDDVRNLAAALERRLPRA